MSDKPGHIPAPPKDDLGPEFDTTAELWDRVVDDIIEQGAPCLDTVEKLVEEACQHDPGPGPRQKRPE